MKGKSYILRTNEDAEALANSILGAEITKPLVVSIAVYEKKRSLAQNALERLWDDVIRKWLYEAGVGFKNARGETIRPYTSDEIHYWNADLFGVTRMVEINGKITKVCRTRDMKVMQFSQFLNDIDAYWAEQGLMLPHPDHLYGEAMGE